MILILVFVFSFGVIAHASMYPNSDLDFKLFNSLVQIAYFPVFVQMSILEDFKQECSIENGCPEKSGIIFSFIVLIFYMIIANVLLINLLIAMFT